MLKKTNVVSATTAWLKGMAHVLAYGNIVKPRGRNTLEVCVHQHVVDMSRPIILVSERGLNYSFAAAEALWIISGDNKLETLLPYNRRMAEFSDDGVTLAGAYGPRILAQLEYVVSTLINDRDTRQAVLTTWNRNPGRSKDIPCTISMQFILRDNTLHCVVSMRSSDLWLGIPYDFFSFSMVAAHVCCRYNERMFEGVRLGSLYLTAGSSHIYEENWELARDILKRTGGECISIEESNARSEELQSMVQAGRWDLFDHFLTACRDKTDKDAAWRIRP